MEETPRLKKRASLSLSRHRNSEASPKRRLDEASTNTAASTSSGNKTTTNTQGSPAVASFSPDVGIECTPPHKKHNLDDSIDYSPKCFDTSFSPGDLLSQTLASDSPEVGWRWGRRVGGSVLDAMITTPDSAYAADSSFTSAGSSSTDAKAARTRNDSQLQRFSYEMRREEQRKAVEMQIRRAEKLRADEMLQQRCAKLQEQLKEAEERNRREKENAEPPQLKVATVAAKVKKISAETAAQVSTAASPRMRLNDTLNDFLNDTDSDCLLIEATQQLESKIVELTQKSTSPAETVVSSAPASTAPAPTRAAHREKRSSLYMKFLEDDFPDDWFLSLDDDVLQATQAKKQRTSLQRHNSMPTTNTIFKKKTNTAGGAVAIKETGTKTTTGVVTMGGNDGASSSKMKRYASSHVLSPASASSSYRARQLHLRK